MHFKGKHRDKRWITYNAGGDGFQADALCKQGFTYQVYMQNDPAPKKYLKEVFCHGVTRKGGRGIADYVPQEEQKSKADQRLACGTVKADILEGDGGCLCLVASSVYNSMPVHYLSMVTHELKWVV
eukprot:14672085-Ditylum_brightwellii.AAC.1